MATRALAPGDLVLVSPALGLLEYEPEDEGGAEAPENEDLARHMMSR